jgi:putative endonuclease
MKAEEAAVGHLQSQGYRIVARNYRARRGEIDIVALDGEVICFVEVRSGNTSSFGDPAESVTQRKRARISLAALQYLKEKGALERRARFDVASVSGGAVRLIKNAFELEGEF